MNWGLEQIDNNEECVINNLNIQRKQFDFYANSFPDRIFPIDRTNYIFKWSAIAFGCNPKCVEQLQIALK